MRTQGLESKKEDIAPQDFFKQTLFQVQCLENLDRQAILARLEQYHFVSIRGLIFPQAVSEALKTLSQNFDSTLDHPAVGETPDQVMGLFQKVTLGTQVQKPKSFIKGQSPKDYERPRFLRILYSPFWQEDRYGFHSLFRTACQVRNILYDLPKDFCIDRPVDGLWTAARIHQFPQGGGFFCAHRDGNQYEVILDKGIPYYYQVFLVLSRKGVDFERGGGFFEENGERYYFEEYCELGDIAIYDGNTLHGVDPVDPHKRLDLNSINGRMAGFVSFYKDLRHV